MPTSIHHYTRQRGWFATHTSDLCQVYPKLLSANRPFFESNIMHCWHLDKIYQWVQQKSWGPLVEPSRYSSKWCNGSRPTFPWSWHPNHCSGFPTFINLMTPLKRQMLIFCAVAANIDGDGQGKWIRVPDASVLRVLVWLFGGTICLMSQRWLFTFHQRFIIASIKSDASYIIWLFWSA